MVIDAPYYHTLLLLRQESHCHAVCAISLASSLARVNGRSLSVFLPPSGTDKGQNFAARSMTYHNKTISMWASTHLSPYGTPIAYILDLLPAAAARSSYLPAASGLPGLLGYHFLCPISVSRVASHDKHSFECRATVIATERIRSSQN